MWQVRRHEWTLFSVCLSQVFVERHSKVNFEKCVFFFFFIDYVPFMAGSSRLANMFCFISDSLDPAKWSMSCKAWWIKWCSVSGHLSALPSHCDRRDNHSLNPQQPNNSGNITHECMNTFMSGWMDSKWIEPFQYGHVTSRAPRPVCVCVSTVWVKFRKKTIPIHLC